MIEDDAALPSGSIVAMRIFNSVAIGQRADGYLNATAMCKTNGKRWDHYKANAGTAEFLDALSQSTGIPVDEQNQGLIQSRAGAPSTGGGTWVHPQVADHLALNGEWRDFPQINNIIRLSSIDAATRPWEAWAGSIRW